MEITQITFRRTVNCGNFENFSVEATAQVAADLDPVGAARALQSYVDALCNERVQVARHPGRRSGHDAGEDADLEKALGL